MKEVSEFEARLLRIVQCLMHHTTVEQTLALLVKPIRRPRCLSRNCVELVQDMLSKGVTEWLARSGWSNSRFLQDSEVVSGRLWHRHPTPSLKLSFSSNSMELLLWLTSQNFVEPKSHPQITKRDLTLGDRLLLLMTFSVIRATLGGPVLLKQPGFRGHGLIELMFPKDVAVSTSSVEPQLEFWCQRDHAWVLESLQDKLAHQWFRIERDKRRMSDHKDMQKIGELQTRAVDALFDGVQQHDRKDLCVFLLMAGWHLKTTVPSDEWFEQLDVRSLRMADRSAVYQAALAWFSAMNRLGEWNSQAQAVGFYDEDYQASQLWKSQWERFDGDQLCRWSAEIIKRTDPIRAVAADNA